MIFFIKIWGPDKNQLIWTTNSWFRGVNFGNHATSPIIFNGRVRVAKKVAAALVWSRLVSWYISCGHLCVWVFSKLWRPLVPKPMVRFGPDFFSRMDYSHLLVVQFSSHSAQRFQSYRGVSHPKYSYSMGWPHCADFTLISVYWNPLAYMPCNVSVLISVYCFQYQYNEVKSA